MMAFRMPRLARSKRARAGFLVVAALLGLSWPGTARAEQIVLTNGEVIECTIISQDEKQVVIRNAAKMVIPIPRERIARIVEQNTASYAEALGDEAVRAGNHEEAIAQYREAVRLGGDREKLAEKARRAMQAIENRNLARYRSQVRDAQDDVRNGNLVSAESKLRALLDQMPANDAARGAVERVLAQVHHSRARNYRDSIDYVAAERELRRAEVLDPNNAAIQIELGDLAALTSRTRNQALSSYIRGMELGRDTLTDAEKRDVAFKIAELYRASGDAFQAMRFYRMVYESNPRYRSNLESTLIEQTDKVANRFQLEGNQDGYIHFLGKILEIRPDDASTRFRLAEALMDKRDHEKALGELDRILEANGSFPSANYTKSKAFDALGRMSDRESALNQELQVNPRHYDALVDLGDLARSRDDFELARTFYLQAKEVDPDLPRATLALGKTERELENYEDAERHIREILALDRNNVEATLELGRIYRDKKSYEQATEMFSRAVTMLEGRGGALSAQENQLMADALLARGEVRLLTTGPGTATRDFEKALEIFPDYPTAYYNIGEAYQKKYNSSKQLPDLKLAEENLLKARNLSPNNPEFALGLGILYGQVLASADEGNKDQYMRNAVEHYESYIDNGGTEVDMVRGWIRESGGDV